MLQQDTSPKLFTGLLVARDREVASAPKSPVVRILKGRTAILEARAQLAELASHSGQPGETDSLPFFLNTPHAQKKIPWLVLLGGDSRSPRPGHPPLSGAALVFEYRTGFGLGSRIFVTADHSGRRDVIAPAPLRARVAALAARTLVERGAHVVHLAFSETHDSEYSPDETGYLASGASSAASVQHVLDSEFLAPTRHIPYRWALLEREIPAYLPLLPTFDATLARIGQRTRSNLRYYRRRTELDLGCVFVDRANLTLEDFLAFNRQSTYAVPDRLAIHRYNTLSTVANCRLKGVRAHDGRWLSLVGIRYHGNFVEIDWQMNRHDMKSYSLGTVLRSYLIESEIARRSTRLYIEGGTPQPISRSFVKQRVGELTVVRNSLYAATLKRLGPWLFPARNYVGQTLRSPDLDWRTVHPDLQNSTRTLI